MSLKVQNISFSYKKSVTISSVSFELTRGKNLAIIGESGCGKSTLLKLIYGLHDLDEGAIFWNHIPVLGPKFNLIPGMDFMKYLAQDFDLMPYITVAENVGKYLSNFYSAKKKERVTELLEIVEMTEFANVKAQHLSGGQMQRVAIARVLALEPEVLLLDEPFSHIDNFRKNSLRRKLFNYLKEKEITTIIATHDSTDVLSFSEEVVIIQNGKIVEQGTPDFIYNNPDTKYVASLFDDVNEMEIDGKKHFVYPHQLAVVDKSEIMVSVLNSYYRGRNFLVESKFGNQIVIFESDNLLKKGETVFLQKKEIS